MKSKQEAEREEQRRIKNLVLNYDLGDNDTHDGTFSLEPIYQRPMNKSSYAKGLTPRTRALPFKSEPRRQGHPARTESEKTESERR